MSTNTDNGTEKSQKNTWILAGVIFLLLITTCWYVFIYSAPKPKKRTVELPSVQTTAQSNEAVIGVPQINEVAPKQNEQPASIKETPVNAAMETVSTKDVLSTEGGEIVKTTIVTTKVPKPSELIVSKQPVLGAEDKEILTLMRDSLILQLKNEVNERRVTEIELSQKLPREMNEEELNMGAPPVFHNDVPANLNQPATMAENMEALTAQEQAEEEQRLKKLESLQREQRINDSFNQIEVAFISVSGQTTQAFLRYKGKVKPIQKNTSFDEFTVKDMTKDYVSVYSSKFGITRRISTPAYSVSEPNSLTSVPEYNMPEQLDLPPQINGVSGY